MKNEKVMTTHVRELVLRIMERALFYNNTPTDKAYTGEKPTFFINFDGHIGALTVSVHPTGYSTDTVTRALYLGRGDTRLINLCEALYYREEVEIIDRLVSVLDDMERIYNDWYTRQEAAPND